MSTEVRASGYIQAAHFAQNTDYGFKIHDNLSGSMHDHVLTFKADFDILGENNTVQFMDVVPHSTTYPWSRGRTFNTMHVERSFLESEDDAAINWPSNSKRQLIVVNQEETNQYGELRGYRVLPMSAAHLTVENSTALQRAGYFATHDLFVTKRKDTEPRCAHPYNSQDTQNPPVDFELFFDGESLNQTDLVLWLNLGMHHVPHT
jgi:primary-amine oxidase